MNHSIYLKKLAKVTSSKASYAKTLRELTDMTSKLSPRARRMHAVYLKTVLLPYVKAAWSDEMDAAICSEFSKGTDYQRLYVKCLSRFTSLAGCTLDQFNELLCRSVGVEYACAITHYDTYSNKMMDYTMRTPVEDIDFSAES